MKVLRFEELQPEQDFFELPDGTKIGFKAQVQFEALDVVQMTGAQKVIQEAMDGVLKGDVDAAHRLDQGMSDAIKLILPEMPDELLNGLGVGKKTAIVAWWNKQNEAEAPALGEAKAGAAVGS